jgi:hypothetical protein
MTDISLQSGARLARPHILKRVLAHRLVRSEWALLTGIVLVSSVARGFIAFASATAVYFPDEYIYSQLARSIAHGKLTIRGAPAHFPALLEPILAAPFWRLDDLFLAYRLTLVMHGVAISLAAIPVYLLARRLGAARWQRAAVALMTVAAPTMTWSAYVTADAIAYPLALGAVAVGVGALEKPRARSQIGFLALAALATFARVQYVVLPVAFLLAVLVVERGHILRAARRYTVMLCAIALPAAVGLAVGLHRILGYYSSLLDFHVTPLGLLHWIAIDSMLIAFATGFALAPWAVSGLVVGLRPRALPAERAFSALTVTFGALVLVETAAYATNGSPRFQERYLVALMGLVPIAFFVGIRALPRGKGLVLALSIVLFVCLVRIPMTGYSAVSGKQDSPFLSAVFYVERLAGTGTGGLLVSIAGAALLAVGAAAALGRRVKPYLALVLAGAVLAFASVGAAIDDLNSARNARATYFDGSLRWIDDTKLGSVDMLLGPGSFPPAMLENLFWNRSLVDVLNLPDSSIVDDFGHRNARIANDGRVLVGGNTVRRPVLVDDYYAALTLQGAHLLRRTPTAALWQPVGPVRLSTMTVGRYFDGWLDRVAVVTVWPRSDGTRTGTLRFRLTFPVTKAVTAVIRVRTPDAPARTIRVRAGGSVPVALPLSVDRPVQVEISGRQPFVFGRRIVSVHSTVPRFVESSAGTAS